MEKLFVIIWFHSTLRKFLNFDTKYYDEFELIFPELSPAEIFQLKQQLKPAWLEPIFLGINV